MALALRYDSLLRGLCSSSVQGCGAGPLGYVWKRGALELSAPALTDE